MARRDPRQHDPGVANRGKLVDTDRLNSVLLDRGSIPRVSTLRQPQDEKK